MKSYIHLIVRVPNRVLQSRYPEGYFRHPVRVFYLKSRPHIALNPEYRPSMH